MAKGFGVEYRRRTNASWDSLAHWKVSNLNTVGRSWAEGARITRAYDLITSMRKNDGCKIILGGKFASAFTDYARQVSKEEGKSYRVEVFGDRRAQMLMQHPDLQRDFIERQERGMSLRENLATTIAAAQSNVIVIYNEGSNGQRKARPTLEIFVLSNRENAPIFGDLKQFFKLQQEELRPVEGSRVIFLISDGKQLEAIAGDKKQLALLEEHGLGARRGLVPLSTREVEDVLLEDCNPLAILRMLESTDARAVLQNLAKMEMGLTVSIDDRETNISTLAKLRSMLNPEGAADKYYFAVQQIILGLGRGIEDVETRRDLKTILEEQLDVVASTESPPRIFTHFAQNLLGQERGVSEIDSILHDYGPEGYGVFSS